MRLLTESCDDVATTVGAGDLNTIRDTLLEVLTEIQNLGGNELPEFTDDLRPLEEIVQFDSLVALDAVLMLSERFETELPDDLFYDPTTHRPSTLGQIIERIRGFLSGGATTHLDATGTIMEE